MKEKDFLGYTNYYFDVKTKDLIGKGEKEVIETLNGLNYSFNEKEKDSFYYIRTKIKVFEGLKLSESIKRNDIFN